MNPRGYVASRKIMVDGELKRILPPSGKHPPLILRAMRYAMFPGGKRFRAVLLAASYETFSGSPGEALPAACAVELVHAYSLVHDDLPALDDDDFRRGKPSLHKKFGEAVAILAGDALLTEAFSVLSGMDTSTFAPEKVLESIRELSLACGASGMIAGQAADIAGTKRLTRKKIEYIHLKKTGALIRSSARCGAILSGASGEELAAVSSYGRLLGMAFQMIDDLKDAGGNGSEPNFADLEGAESARKKAHSLLVEARAEAGRLGKKGGFLEAVADYLGDTMQARPAGG